MDKPLVISSSPHLHCGMNTRGSGLGLHICKILINLSGGQIHAESEEGKWCRFLFTLPCGQ